MGNKLRFTCTSGPHGDATSNYSISFPEGMTVEEFAMAVIRENTNEWGYISIGWNNKVVQYDRGGARAVGRFEEVRDRVVTKATANGGWGLMSYDLELEPLPKPQVEVDIHAKTDFPF